LLARTVDRDQRGFGALMIEFALQQVMRMRKQLQRILTSAFLVLAAQMQCALSY
jgi:hypothetical protein